MSSYLNDDVVIPALYATPADYQEWTGKEGPDGLLPILRACTGIVYEATSGDVYDVDEATGLPTASRIVQAFRDATCIQAAAWVKLDIDPFSGGVQEANATSATTKKIGSAVITRSDGEAAAVAVAQAAARESLVPEAVKLLRRNGLASTAFQALG